MRSFAFILCCCLFAIPQATRPDEPALKPATVSGTRQPSGEVKKSAVISGFEWLGEQITYPPPRPGEDLQRLGPQSPWFGAVGLRIHGDTFPMTWTDDNEIYTSAGDPHWGGKNDGLDIEKLSGTPPDYTIRRVNPMTNYRGNGGEGTKPSGMICVKGVLYLAFQNLLGKKPPAHGEKSQHGSDAFIVASKDHGKTWTPDIRTITQPMFPGHNFGGPAFINFGRNNENARDGYVYAVSTDQWDNGSHLRLGRVPADRITEAQACEWVAGFGADHQPHWTRELDQAIPILSDERQISLPDMVYVAAVKRYLLLTWRLKKDFSSDDGSELMIYDSPEPWGPFALVHHEANWESPDVNPYCPRLPLKWLQVSGGRMVGWIQFSGSWRQNSLQYCSHVRKFTARVKAAKTSRAKTQNWYK
jgi:hypothetical protein